MAKKNNNENEAVKDPDESVGSKIGTALLIVLIVIVWLAIFALLIKMDVAGIGTKLRPLIKDVPGLNIILPEVSEDVLISERNYPYSGIEETIEIIKDLENQVDSLEDSNEEYRKKILELQAEVDRLKFFEEDQLAFEERVREFDLNVVYNSQAPDIEEYKKYYEEINPETAEKIYNQVLEQLQVDALIVEKADILKKMKPANAAAALEEMTADLEYTCQVLLAMKTEEATAIMDKMDALFVARIIQTMHDMDDRYKEKVNSLIER